MKRGGPRNDIWPTPDWSAVRQQLDALLKPKVRCTKCQREWPGSVEYFRARPEKKNGLASTCRECDRERARNRMRVRRADPAERERVLEEKRRHLQSAGGREWKRRASLIENHKRRQNEVAPGAPWNWNIEAWEACLARWGCCAYCGVVGERLQQEHYVPLAHPSFPGTVPTNIVPACSTCNALKRERHPDDVFPVEVRARILEYFEGLR